MALGMGKGGRRFHMGHLIGSFLFIAFAAWAGLKFIPAIATKIQGLFTKSSSNSGS